MNKYLLSISIAVFIFLSTSCFRCSDTICLNNSDCDRKTGDCISDCHQGTNNPSNGNCECDIYFTGNNCEREIRLDYADKYIGSLQIGTRVYDDTLEFVRKGTDPRQLVFNEGLAFLELTSNFSYDIRGNLEVNGEVYRIDSISGSYQDRKMEFEGEAFYKYTFWGQEYESTTILSFSGYRKY